MIWEKGYKSWHSFQSPGGSFSFSFFCFFCSFFNFLTDKKTCPKTPDLLRFQFKYVCVSGCFAVTGTLHSSKILKPVNLVPKKNKLPAFWGTPRASRKNIEMHSSFERFTNLSRKKIGNSFHAKVLLLFLRFLFGFPGHRPNPVCRVWWLFR